eukprot:m.97812 g.97812  ORF g.97812 m.97812 type:complete len:119 (+) comp36963_c0_seq7:1339-1695(+)
MTDYRPELVELVLSYLKPEFARTRVVSKAFEGKTDRKETWYGTEYSLSKMDAALIEKWKTVELNPDLHLPPVNEFIPTNLELFPCSPDSPSIPIKIKVFSKRAIFATRERVSTGNATC